MSTLKNIIKIVGNHLTSQFSPEMILGMVLTDFSVHSLPNFFTNQDILDFIWHYNNGDIIPHILGNPNSSSVPRQFLSSFSHFHRYEITSIFSILDSIVSSILNTIFSTDYFTSRNSKIREFKRKMLTCVRNGGVYLDIAKINLTMNIQTDYARVMSKDHPLFNRSIKVFQNFDNSVDKDDHNKVYVQNSSPDFKMSYDEIKSLFEQETSFSFNSVFKAVSEKPSSVRNDIAEFDAILSTGEDVTISIIPPNRHRLRQMDLFPPRSLLFLLNLIGLDTKIRKRYKYYMHRLDFDFEREVHARQKILKSYGIDFLHTSPHQLFQSVDSLRLPLSIPAPLRQFSSKYFMVTARKPMYYVRSLSVGNVNKVMDMASQLFFDHNIVIPDLSPYNIKIEKNQVSVDRLYSMCEITEDEVKGFSNIIAASALKENKYSDRAKQFLQIKPIPRLLNHFGFIRYRLNGYRYDSHFNIESIEKEKNGNSQMVLRHANALFSLAELRMSLYGNLEKAGKLSEESIHYFSKPITKLVGANSKDEKIIYDYLRHDAMEIFS